MAQHFATDQRIDAVVAPTHLLLAEDDAEMRSMLVSVLQADGYLVTEACDGEELVEKAIELAEREEHEQLDVIVSDIRMPGHSGLDVLALVRAARWQVPVILITAFGDLAIHRQAERDGACAVLDKPFDLDDLRTLLFHFAPPR